MKTFFLLGVCILGFSLNAQAAIDPFKVYSAKAPSGCLDKSIGKTALTLTDLISIGICNNPLLNQDFMSVKAAEADLGQARSEYLPSVDGTAGAMTDYEKEQHARSMKNDPYSGNLALNWLLYDFGGRSARNDRTRAYLETAQFSYNTSLQDLVFSISQTYYNLLGSQEVLKSAKMSEESFRKSYQESKRKFELGLVSASDKLLAKTSYEQSKLAVIQAENDVKINTGNLAYYLNLSPRIEFNLVRPKRDKKEIDLETKQTVDELIELALSARSEVKGAKSDVEATKQNINVAKAAALPSVSATSGVSYNDDWKNSNPYQYGASAGIKLSVPLFTGFSDTYKISKARYQYSQAQSSLTNTQDTVRNQVWSAYQDYLTAVSSFENSKVVLKSAEENQRVAFAMYQVGKGSILNLLTAESQLSTSRQENIVSFYGVLTAKAKLYRSIGRFN